MAKIRVGNIRKSVSLTDSNYNDMIHAKTYGVNTSKLEDALRESVEEVIKSTATMTLNTVFKRQWTSGGYGVKAKENSQNSISKWQVEVDNSDGKSRAMFFNTAVNKKNDFQYVPTLYGEKGRREDGDFDYHYHYGSKENPKASTSKFPVKGMNEARVKKMKENVKNRFINAFKKKGL